MIPPTCEWKGGCARPPIVRLPYADASFCQEHAQFIAREAESVFRKIVAKYRKEPVKV